MALDERIARATERLKEYGEEYDRIAGVQEKVNSRIDRANVSRSGRGGGGARTRGSDARSDRDLRAIRTLSAQMVDLLRQSQTNDGGARRRTRGGV